MSFNNKSSVGPFRQEQADANKRSVDIHRIDDSSRSLHGIQENSVSIFNDKNVIVLAMSQERMGWNNIAIDRNNGIKEAENVDIDNELGTFSAANTISTEAISSSSVTMDNELVHNCVYTLGSFMVYVYNENINISNVEDSIIVYIPDYPILTTGLYIPKIPIPVTIKNTSNYNGTTKTGVVSQITIPVLFKTTSDIGFTKLEYKTNFSYLGSTAGSTHLVWHTNQDISSTTPTEFKTKWFKGKNRNSQIASCGISVISSGSTIGANHFALIRYKLRLKNTWYDYLSISHFGSGGVLSDNGEGKALENTTWATFINSLIATITVLSIGANVAIPNIWNPVGWIIALSTLVAGLVTFLSSAFGVDWAKVFGWPKADYSGINGIEVESIEIYGESQDPSSDLPKYKYYVEHRGEYFYYYDKGLFYDGHWKPYKFDWTKSSTKSKSSNNSGLGLKKAQFRIVLAPDEEVDGGSNSFLSDLTVNFVLNDQEQNIIFTAPSDLRIDYSPFNCYVEEDPDIDEDNFQLKTYLKYSGETDKYLVQSSLMECIYVDTSQFASSKGLGINLKLSPVYSSGISETTDGIEDGDTYSYIATPVNISEGWEATPQIPYNKNIICRVSTPISSNSIREIDPTIYRMAYLFDNIYIVKIVDLSNDIPVMIGLEVDGEYIIPTNLLNASDVLSSYLQDNVDFQIDDINVLSSNLDDIQLVVTLRNNTNTKLYIYIIYNKLYTYSTSIYIKDKMQRNDYILFIYPLKVDEEEADRAIEYLAFPNDSSYRKRDISIYVNDSNLLYREPLDYSILMSHGGLSWFASERFLGKAFGRIEDITSYVANGNMLPYKFPYLHIPVIYPNFKADQNNITGSTDPEKARSTITEVSLHMGYDYDIMPYNRPEPLSIGWIELPSVNVDTKVYDIFPETLVGFLDIENLGMLNYIANKILTVGREQFSIVNKTLHKKSNSFNLMAKNTAPVIKEKGEFFSIANYLIASTEEYTAIYASNDFELMFLYSVPAKTLVSPVIIGGRILLTTTVGIYVLSGEDSTLIYRFPNVISKAAIRTLGTDDFILFTEELGDENLIATDGILTVTESGEDTNLTVEGNIHTIYKISEGLAVSKIDYDETTSISISDFSDNFGDDLFILENDSPAKFVADTTSHSTYKLISRYIRLNNTDTDESFVKSVLVYALNTNTETPSDMTVTLRTQASSKSVTKSLIGGLKLIVFEMNFENNDVFILEIEASKNFKIIGNVKLEVEKING